MPVAVQLGERIPEPISPNMNLRNDFFFVLEAGAHRVPDEVVFLGQDFRRKPRKIVGADP